MTYLYEAIYQLLRGTTWLLNLPARIAEDCNTYVNARAQQDAAKLERKARGE